MAQRPASEPISVRTDKVAEIDALADAMNQSRSDIVNQAIEQYLETNAWQMERIKDGATAARNGKVRPAGEVFDAIAAKHGWTR